MGIFNRSKKAAEEAVNTEGKKVEGLPKSGCGSIKFEQVAEINRTLFEKDEEITNFKSTFARGFIAGLMFVATPESAETYGDSARDYMDNAFAYVLEDSVRQAVGVALGEAAKNVLESMGLDVRVETMTADETAELVKSGDA